MIDTATPMTTMTPIAIFTPRSIEESRTKECHLGQSSNSVRGEQKLREPIELCLNAARYWSIWHAVIERFWTVDQHISFRLIATEEKDARSTLDTSMSHIFIEMYEGHPLARRRQSEMFSELPWTEWKKCHWGGKRHLPGSIFPLENWGKTIAEIFEEKLKMLKRWLVFRCVCLLFQTPSKTMLWFHFMKTGGRERILVRQCCLLSNNAHPYLSISRAD